MTPKENPLNGNELSSRVPSVEESSEIAVRVRHRFQEEMRVRGISQRQLADMLSGLDNQEWTQSRVGKVLTGRVDLKIHDADLIARALRMSLTEAVRDRGLEFYAELTPTEVRLLERLRQRPNTLDGILMILDLKSSTGSTNVPLRRKRGRPLNSERTQPNDK
jgi:transcriptional regulator with XRE-family HTH domain